MEIEDRGHKEERRGKYVIERRLDVFRFFVDVKGVGEVKGVEEKSLIKRSYESKTSRVWERRVELRDQTSQNFRVNKFDAGVYSVS